jgi:hypothetical protein
MYVLDFLQVAVLLVVFILYFRLDSKVGKINLDAKSDKLDELNKYLVSMQLDTDKRLLEHSFEFSRIKDKLRDNDLAMKKQALQIKFNDELAKRDSEQPKSQEKKYKVRPKKENKQDELVNNDVKSVWSTIIGNSVSAFKEKHSTEQETKITTTDELSDHVSMLMEDKYGLGLKQFKHKNYVKYKRERDKIYSRLYYHCLTKGKSLESYLKQMEKKKDKTTNEQIF